MLQVYLQDEDGYYKLGDLSHLGAIHVPNYEEIARGGFRFQQEGGKKARKAVSITHERYVGIERRLRPQKTRDEGERRLGCPLEPTATITKLLNRRSMPAQDC